MMPRDLMSLGITMLKISGKLFQMSFQVERTSWGSCLSQSNFMAHNFCINNLQGVTIEVINPRESNIEAITEKVRHLVNVLF